MAVAKTKTPETEEVKVEETEAPKGDSELRTTITDVLKEILPDLLKGQTVEETTVETKPPTLREEESRMNKAVREEIGKLKEAMGLDKKQEEETEKVIESVPGATTVRKIEKWMWGI
jgi:hypothetical protein